MSELEIKSDLLLYGIKTNQASDELYFHQNPSEVEKTGNYGVFLNIGKFKVLVHCGHEFNQKSPYSIIKVDDGYQLAKDDKSLNLDIAVMQMPTWSKKTLSNGKNFSEYFVYEGDGFLHLGYKSCAFSKEDMCKFCATKRAGNEDNFDFTAIEVANAAIEVLPEIPENVHFCLGGGTYLPFEKNVDYFYTIVKTIREAGYDNPIWIEMIPPSKADIKRLVDAGTSAFGFNLEVFDDKQRQFICPGKSKVNKEQYLDGYKYAQQLLGEDKVGCCLIVGLDDSENIKKGIDWLTSNGCHPCILPLNLYNGCTLKEELNWKNVDKNEFTKLSKYAIDKMRENNLTLANNYGCLKCPCCTIQHDYEDLLSNTIR